MPDIPKINVLIVDNTPFYRKIFVDVLRKLPQIDNVQVTTSGESALQKLGIIKFNLILLDVDMPGLGGFETLKKITTLYPNAAVVMLSSENKTATDITLQSLRAGAIDFIEKPTSNDLKEIMLSLSKDIKRIITLIHIHEKTPSVKKLPIPYPPSKAVIKPTPPPAIPGPFDLIAIGCSTGGPQALNAILPHFPRNTNCPILIVQHMPPTFTTSLAEMLNQVSSLPLKEASHNEIAIKNNIYIAPGNFHMKILYDHKNVNHPILIQLNDKPKSNDSCPSFDVLLESISNFPEIITLCIILTGMGSDGMIGISRIPHEKRFCIAQDPMTCAIYGMPKAVIEHNLADAIVPLSDIPDRIKTLLSPNKNAS